MTTPAQYNQAEQDLDFMMERIISLVWSQSIVNSAGVQQMIADSSPAYPITIADAGVGTAIIQNVLTQDASVYSQTYPIYYPAPLADGSDPDNIFGNYSTVDGYIYPAQDTYTQVTTRYQNIGRGPVDQRWEMINDSQAEYGFCIRSKLVFSV